MGTFVVLVLVLVMSVKVKSTELKVEHVFFRQKSEVHTTRSQWIVGLVLDLSIYEKYLNFTDNMIDQAIKTATIGKTHYDRLLTDREYRLRMYHKTGAVVTSVETTPLRQYCNIINGQYRELLVLQELHQQNWKDFLELKRVGHSELELSRMKHRPKRVAGILLGITGLFSGFSLFSTYKLKAEVKSLRRNQETIRTVVAESLSLINLTRMEVRENRLAINKIIDGMGDLVREFKGTVIPLRKFVITNNQMQTNIGKIGSLVAAESNLIAELHQKVAKLGYRPVITHYLTCSRIGYYIEGN